MPSSLNPARPPKAYSYLRFSTPAQMEGDSFRRQTALADRYARDHGLDLDRSLRFEDLGVSAYRGANADTGRLADFKEAVKARLVPAGSYLLVESLDRLSRLTPRKALRGLEDIIELDINVVTLNDRKVYTQETLDNDQISLIMAIVSFMRANEESATKARRIRAAWEGKRLAANEKPLTSSCPAWLTLDKAKGVFLVDQGKATVLRRIYSELKAGLGLETIAKRLNQEQVPTFGRGKMWHRSYILKLRSSPATIGTFIPHQEEHSSTGMKRIPLAPILNYFPAVIDPEVFHEVQAMAQGRSPSTKTNHGLKSTLAGLAKCPRCSETMTRITKGIGSKAGKPYLVCVAAKRGKGCQYKAVRLEEVEDALFSDLNIVLSEPPLPNAKEQSKRDRLQASCDALEEGIGALLEAIEAKPLPSLLKRLEELEGDLENAKSELRMLDEKENVGDFGLLLSRAAACVLALEEPVRDTVRINACLRQLFRRIVVNYETGELQMEWKQGGYSHIIYAWPRVTSGK